MSISHAGLPWYREPWPWLLMAGPAAVVLAGAVTVWLAIATDDGLVVDDYYKRGLAINQTLQRNDAAIHARYRATLSVDPGAGRFVIVLTAGNGIVLPEALRLRLIHPTRSGHDRMLMLRGREGRFEGALAPLEPGRWNVLIEDEKGTWRIGGRVTAPAERTIRLTAQPR